MLRLPTRYAEDPYSENTTLSISLIYSPPHLFAGQTVDFNGDFHLEEISQTAYYNGKAGATDISNPVSAEKGVATIVLKSVSNSDSSIPDPALIRIKVDLSVGANVAADVVSISQWVDNDGTEIPDWLEQHTANRLQHFKTQASGALVRNVAQEVIGLSYTAISGPLGTSCGYTDHSTRISNINLYCEIPNGHRTDLGGRLSNTVIHESRHAWQGSLARGPLSSGKGSGASPANDSDLDWCPEFVPPGTEAERGDSSAIVDDGLPIIVGGVEFLMRGDNDGEDSNDGDYCIGTTSLTEIDAGHFGNDHQND